MNNWNVPQNERRYHTHEIQAAPFVAVRADGYLESHVALCHQRWLHANGPISADHMANNGLRIEFALDAVVFVKAWPRNVDNCAAQHVSRLGRKHQRQKSGVYMHTDRRERASNQIGELIWCEGCFVDSFAFM